MEDRIAGLKDKIDIKKQNQKNTYREDRRVVRGICRNPVTPSKKPNLRLTGIKEEEMQVKCIGNIINKIVAEIFPNLKEELPIQVQEASRKPNRHDQNRTSPWHIIVKTISTENKERILEAVREKNQIT
jgi:hypothetical protein